MSEAPELPPLFAGATHRMVDGGEPVRAVQWNKPEDDARVEMYPIDKPNRARVYHGLLRADVKTRFALSFGDWILQDSQGRVWIEHSLSPTKYRAVEAA